MSDRKILPLDQLKGVLTVIDRSREPPATVLRTVREMVGDAVSVLVEPDPLKRKCMLVLGCIVESTEIEHHAWRGEDHEIVKVTNRDLYGWAVREAHKIVEAHA